MASAASLASAEFDAAPDDRQVKTERIQRVALDLASPDLACDRDRALAQDERFAPAIEQHQDLTVARQDARQFGRGRIGRHDGHRRLIRLEGSLRLGVDPEGPSQPFESSAQADRIGVPAERRDSLASECHAASGVAGQPCRLGGSPEQVHPIDPGEFLRVVDRRPGLESPLVVASRVGECERPRRRFPSSNRRLEGTSIVARRRPVVGELAPVSGGDRPAVRPALGQCLREAAVQALAFTRQEVVVGGLLEQGVAEHVVAGDVARSRTGDEDLAADRIPKPVQQVIVGESRHVGEQIVIDPPTGDRGDADDGLGALGQRDDPGQQDLPQRRRQPATIGLGPGAEQLLHEERVAVGSAVDLIDEVRCRRRVEDRRKELTGVRGVESLDLQALHQPAAVELGEPRQKRMAAMQLVGPEGHDQDDPIRAELSDEERDGLARGGVGPVEVLDDEDHRFDFGQTLEDAEDRIEEPRLQGLGLGAEVRAPIRSQRRDEPGEVVTRTADDHVQLVGIERPDHRPERLDDRTVGHAAVTDISAVADDDAHPAGRADGRRLGHQTRLADAGLARHELMDRGAGGRAVDRACDRGKLRRSSHERRADQAAWHPQMIRIDHRVAVIAPVRWRLPDAITRNQQATRPMRSRHGLARTRGGWTSAASWAASKSRCRSFARSWTIRSAV